MPAYDLLGCFDFNGNIHGINDKVHFSATGKTPIEEFGKRFWVGLALPLLFLCMIGALRLRRGKMTLTPRGRYYWLVVMRSVLSVAGDYRQKHDYGNVGSSGQVREAVRAADSDDAERIPVTIDSAS